MKDVLCRIAVAHLCLLIAMDLVLRVYRGDSWWLTLFLFSPRWIVGLPAVVLMPLLNIRYPHRWTAAYLVTCAALTLSIMGFQLADFSLSAPRPEDELRLMTCNLGGGFFDVSQLVALAKTERVDVLMLQECPASIGRETFEQLGWEFHQTINLAVGTRFEILTVDEVVRRPPGTISAERFNNSAALICRVAWQAPPASNGTAGPQRAIQLVNIHLPTFRPAFELARRFDTQADEEFERLGLVYREMATRLVKQIDAYALPTLVAGDFNVPEESVFFSQFWGGYQNALSRRGWGFNYTKYTRLHGVRIDHVLADAPWGIASASVGPDLGGDHRPVIASLWIPSNRTAH